MFNPNECLKSLKAADLFYECLFSGCYIFFRTALRIFQLLTLSSRYTFKYKFQRNLGKKLFFFFFPKKIHWSNSHLVLINFNVFLH